jgi:hypothetical protein
MRRTATTARRITFGLTEPGDQALNFLTQKTGENQTDVINQALRIYRMLEEGGRLLMPGEDGELERVRFF